MTPRQKAEELVRKYYSFGLNNPAQSFSWYECKQCALIAVDEILRSHHNLYGVNSKQVKFYLEVQQEIEKL
jgi:hypothetical protein